MPAVRKRKVILSPQQESKALREIYFNARHPASFGGIEKLADATNIHPKNVQKWLSKQWTYTLHKPIRKNFKRRRYVTRGVNEQWQADLAEMQHYSRENHGMRYILFVIDIFSRYTYARPLKSKTGPDVAAALETIFQEANETPRYLQTDLGKEFYNQHVDALLKRYNIELFSVNSEMKASIVERVQRTIKERMYRAFTYHGTHRWMELLPEIIQSYNNSYHRGIKHIPAKVNKQNETSVWIKQYSDLKKPSTAPKFSVGDEVRIHKSRTIFSKGYEEKWTDEIFTITFINDKYSPVLYSLKDHNGETIKGSFYANELQKIDNSEKLYRIDKIIRKRYVRGKKQALVKWKGYSEPSWIDISDLQSVSN